MSQIMFFSPTASESKKIPIPPLLNGSGDGTADFDTGGVVNVDRDSDDLFTVYHEQDDNGSNFYQTFDRNELEMIASALFPPKTWSLIHAALTVMVESSQDASGQGLLDEKDTELIKFLSPELKEALRGLDRVGRNSVKFQG